MSRRRSPRRHRRKPRLVAPSLGVAHSAWLLVATAGWQPLPALAQHRSGVPRRRLARWSGVGQSRRDRDHLDGVGALVPRCSTSHSVTRSMRAHRPARPARALAGNRLSSAGLALLRPHLRHRLVGGQAAAFAAASALVADQAIPGRWSRPTWTASLLTCIARRDAVGAQRRSRLAESLARSAAPWR
jgi:hypothetical protein